MIEICEHGNCRRNAEGYYEAVMLDCLSNEGAGGDGNLCIHHRKMLARYINGFFMESKEAKR